MGLPLLQKRVTLPSFSWGSAYSSQTVNVMADNGNEI